jgi:type I restriction enzyme S subunit
LLPQDANDEPAIELLKRIQAEKPVSKKTRHPERSETSPPNEVAGGGEILRCTQDDGVGGVEHPPFEIPPSWVWTRLGEVIQLSSGDFLPSYKMITDGDFPVYGGNGINGRHDSANVFSKSIVIGRVGFYCGSVHLTQGDAWVTDNAFVTKYSKENIYQDFLFWLLKAINLNDNDKGTAQPVISGKKVYPIPIPLPPLAEQKRIVAKVDACFAKLDALAEQLKTQRQHIQHSKKALLQRAVSGRLVPQIPEEGTGHDLLKQIQAEKHTQTKATTKKGKSL